MIELIKAFLKWVLRWWVELIEDIAQELPHPLGGD